MSKLIKKYQSFLENVYAAQPAREEETITPAIDPGEKKREKGMPVPRKKDLDQPSVSPDPLALADLEDLKNGKDLKNGISNPKIIDNEYLYNDVYRIAYPSETKCYTVNNVKLSDDPQSVIDYINQKEDDKKNKYPDKLSDVTVDEDGNLKGFTFDEDPEDIAAKGGSTEGQPGREEFSRKGREEFSRKDESKSYKSSRKFNKRK